MQFTGPDLGKLANVLLGAFPLARFDRMLLYGMNINREHIAIGSSMEEIVFTVLVDLNSQDKILSLIRAARDFNTSNAALFAYAQQFHAAIQTPPRDVLERKIKEANSALDVTVWREKLAVLENQICRIEVNGNMGVTYGTGFLVGSASVITNYHVMADVISGAVGPQNVILRFGYRKLSNGVEQMGETFTLADTWLIDQSPYSPIDEERDPKTGVPQPNQLDYALLRVKDAPGDAPIGGAKDDLQAPARKWITLPADDYGFAPHSPLFILQHPDGEPLKLVLDNDAILENGLNSNRTRVRYSTNTESGSSGSPCFDQNWNLVALHHSGDPNFDLLHQPTYNQGIPIKTIYALLQEKGYLSALGKQED